jgi:hypothetical protein
MRLGRMMASEPELTEPVTDEAGEVRSRRFVAYLFADGHDYDRMVTRMERLKFEAIVTGKSLYEALAGMEEP